MRIGYARVSTADENLDLQEEVLKRSGIDQLFADVASGAKAKRPQLELALSHLCEGDTLVVYSLKVLGLNVCYLIEMVKDLNRRGVRFRSLQENLDTTTSAAKFAFQLLGGPLADLDRYLIRRRTGPGQAAAKARGQKGGRKPKLDEGQRAVAVTLHEDLSNSVPDICRKLRISPATYYRYVDKEPKRKAGRKPKPETGEVLSTGQGRRVGQETRSPTDGG